MYKYVKVFRGGAYYSWYMAIYLSKREYAFP